MGTIYNTANDFWIKPGALNIGINHFDDPSLIEVSLLSGAVIMAYRYNVIDYNAAHNYRTWNLSASRTYLQQTGKVYVYARLERGGNKAQVIYSYDKRDMFGVIVDEDGDISEPDSSHYYILLGILSSCIDAEGNKVLRTWEEGPYTGKLATDQYIKEESKGDLDKMFKYNSVTDFIDVLKTISSATINILTVAKEFIIGGKIVKDVAVSNTSSANPSDEYITSAAYVNDNFISSKRADETDGHITFKDGVTINKHITLNKRTIQVKDISKEIVQDTFAPSDDHVPSTKAVTEHVTKYTDEHYIHCDEEDTAKEKIIFEKGIEVSSFTSGVADGTGGAFRKEEDGNVHLTTDYLNVRRKARFNEVEILTTHHIGGAQMSSAASCKIDHVVTRVDGVYQCFFRKTDADGRTITNDWKKGDQAYCNTFNLQEQADGTKGNHYFWRLVVSTDAVTGTLTSDLGETFNADEYHCVWMAMNNCAEGSDAPLAGDEVVLLGHQPLSGESEADYAGRQTAVYQVASGADGRPYYRQYVGINSFSLDGCLEQQFMPNDNIFKGQVVVTGEGWKGLRNEAGEDLGESLEAVKEIGGDLSYSATNMLRNTGFYGEGQSADVNANTMMNVDTETLSPSLEHWTAVDVHAVEWGDSPSGYAIEFNGVNASISQNVETVYPKETYIVSFQGIADIEYTISFGGVTEIITADTRRTKVKIVATENPSSTFAISCKISGSKVYGLLLERGTVASNNWIRSVYDVNPEIYRLQNLQYLANAIRNGSTTVNGGLILSNIIQLGNFVDGILKQVTSGVSGVYNTNTDVALWAGGTFEHAANTIAKIYNNPFYSPTEEELAEMAKFVVTHGGTAILNEAIVRGTVYATNGIFNGEVNATSGIFQNVVINGAYNRLVQTISDNNLEAFCLNVPNTYDGSYYPYLLKWGDVIHLKTTKISKIILPNSIPVLNDSNDIIYENVLGYKIDQGNVVPMTMDDLRSLIGRKIVIHGNHGDGLGITIDTGIYKDVSPDLDQDIEFIIPTLDRGEWRTDGIYPNLANGGCVILECILAERKITKNNETYTAEMIAWAAQNIRVSASWQINAEFYFYIWFNDRRINFTGNFGMTWADYIEQDTTQAWSVDAEGYVVWSIEDTEQYIYLSSEDANNGNKVKGSDDVYPNHEYYAYM